MVNLTSTVLEHLNETIDRTVSSMRIIFEPRSFRKYMIVLNNLEMDYKVHGCDRLQRAYANDFAIFVRDRLARGDVEGKTDYNDKYERWKTAHFGRNNILRLKDDLLLNITYFRVGGDFDGWMGGVPNDVYESTDIGTSWLYPPESPMQFRSTSRGNYPIPREIAKYAKLHEFGLGGMPKRQLFSPATTAYARNASRRRGLGAIYLRHSAWRWKD